jgi:hypothetical protein
LNEGNSLPQREEDKKMASMGQKFETHGEKLMYGQALMIQLNKQHELTMQQPSHHMLMLKCLLHRKLVLLV